MLENAMIIATVIYMVYVAAATYVPWALNHYLERKWKKIYKNRFYRYCFNATIPWERYDERWVDRCKNHTA